MKEWQVARGPEAFSHVCGIPSADGAPPNTIIRCLGCSRTYIAQASTSADGVVFAQWHAIDWPRERGPYKINDGDE